jgi:hypothetical protein
MLTVYEIALLDAAAAEDEGRRRQAAALDALIRAAWTPPPGAPDVTAMLREMRGSPSGATTRVTSLRRAKRRRRSPPRMRSCLAHWVH